MDLSTLVGVGGVPVIVALVQLVKPFIRDERYYPILAVLFGMAWNVAVAYATGTTNLWALLQAILVGVVIGLAAAGLYSSSRTVMRS